MTQQPPPLRFDPFRLHPGGERLWRGSEAVHLTPKAFQVLRHLAERAGELVTKQELFAAVWAGTAVGDDALTRCIRELRRALGDDARAPRFLETVHRRGFRFLASVELEEEPAPAAAERGRPRVLVGRAGDLAQGRAALDEAFAGSAQLLLLCGEPGIGKTRLVEELVEESRRRGALVRWGSGYEGEGVPPFWIWIQILRRHAGETEPEALREQAGSGLEDLADLVPEIRERTAAPSPRATRSPDEARFHVFDAVTQLLVRASLERPLVLVLDDLHAADRASLLLLRFFVQGIHRARILLVGTYRDVGRPANAALDEALGELAQARAGRRLLELRGLDGASVADLLAALSDRHTAARLAAAAHETTGGNPLYVQELARAIERVGADAALAEWRSQAPAPIRQVLARRLEGLSPACRGALSLAAVAGTECAFGTLVRATPEDEASFADGIAEAEAERLVSRAGERGSRLRFTHGLLREVLYESLRPGARARLHRRIAHALREGASGSADPPVAELAHHFGRGLLGGSLEDAIHYATLAGVRAASIAAFDEAAQHFEAALEALEAADPPDPVRLSGVALACARAHWAGGRPERARELARRGLDAARASASPQRFAKAAESFGEFEAAGGRESAAGPVLEEALGSLGDQDPTARARLLSLLSMEHFRSARPEEHARLAGEAIELARRSGDARARLQALDSRCHALREPRHEAEWRETYEEMIALARAAVDADHEFLARLHRLEHLVQLADPAPLARELAELDTLADHLVGTYGPRASVARAKAGLAIARGELAEAQELAERALELGRRTDAGYAVMVSHLQIGTILGMQGRVQELAEAIQGGAAANPLVGLYQTSVIYLLCDAGRGDEARPQLQTLVDEDFRSLSRDYSHTVALANLSLSCAQLGHEEGAARLYELLLPYAGRVLTLGSYYTAGCASRFLGILAGSLRRWPEAIRHFETSLAVDARLGARALEAQERVDYARMRLARGAPGDTEAARRLLGDAQGSAAKLGMRVVERECEALLAG